MDVTMLSRMQFAVATYFHFLFVPLTLGLSILLAIMETRYVRTGKEEYKAMTRFWGRLFLINFVVGVVTGITLEFQFGTNWSRYSRYVGDIFGPLLAIEATVAFFLESTFIAVWALGWERLSRRAHAITIWLVAAAANVSAVWILMANAWMQHPVGYVMSKGKPVLSDLLPVVTQGYALLTIAHTLSAAYVVTGFFVMGVSAYHLLRKQFSDIFTRSFRTGLYMALIFGFIVVIQGHFYGTYLSSVQPAKLASLETLWKTRDHAPIYLLVLPDAEREENSIEIGPLPGALSLLAHHSTGATVTGLRDIPRQDRPPVLVTFLSFRLMTGLGSLLLLLVIVAWIRRNHLARSRLILRSFLYLIPLPYILCGLGWTVAEMGRQPWIVYGLMRTSDAASPVAGSQVAVSLAAFLVVYLVIGVIAFRLIAHEAAKGPVSTGTTYGS
ncbi:MAG TPA: cytochrome ubiquinol oxidase subunit I [Syntrophorhabdales bacterium]|nr:cytochrome ubiquinol oxidase subunit I [Syntrophorhabdales bacterium]